MRSFWALRRVESGELPPNVANSKVGLAKAIVDVTASVETDERIRKIEETIDRVEGGRLRWNN